MQSKRQGWVMPFLIEALKTLQLVEQFPNAWHPLSPEIRRCRLRRFPYSVVYTQDAQTFWCSPSRTSTANPAIGSIGVAEDTAPFRLD